MLSWLRGDAAEGDPGEAEAAAAPPATSASPPRSGLVPRPPARPSPSPAKRPKAQYQVKPDDTVAGVALRHGMRPTELRKLNRLSVRDSVFAGMTLLVYTDDAAADDGDSPAPPPPPAAAAAAAASAAPPAPPSDWEIVDSGRDADVEGGSAAAADVAGSAAEAPPAPPAVLACGVAAEDVVLCGRCGAGGVGGPALCAAIAAALPEVVRGHNWRLLYSSLAHGAHLQTFYARARGETRTVAVVRTICGRVFGGFASSEWRHAKEYYGTGESFLFGCDAENGAPTATPYRWTHRNSYFMRSDASLAMGGGGASGEFGLFLEGDFSTGSSGACDTYGNPGLGGASTHFEVDTFELWGLTLARTDEEAAASAGSRRRASMAGGGGKHHQSAHSRGDFTGTGL